VLNIAPRLPLKLRGAKCLDLQGANLVSPVTLRKALGVLAKSSPFSVKTTSDRPRDVYDDLKE
ncbi:hypothetical protein ACV1C9_23265, partial [Aeromonas caviae]